MEQKKFNLGVIGATTKVVEKWENDKDFARKIESALFSYILCKWGDTCEEDAKLNDEAIKTNERIVARYDDIFIITEADRSRTTILFKDEY